MRNLLNKLVIIATVCLAVTPAFALTPAAGAFASTRAETNGGGVGIRLVDIPVAAQNDPRARHYIVDNLPPGTTIERRTEVVNTSDSTQLVSVYAGSAQIVSGSFLGDDNGAQNDLTNWTSVSESDLQLDAGESVEVMVTTAVPLDAPEGELYGAIWAEVSAPGQDGATIQTASRVGIRMYVSVGPGNGPAADFSIGELEASRTDDGVPQVTAQVTNTGGRAVDVSGSLQLSDGPSSLSAGPFSTEQTLTLAPGEDGEVVVSLGADLPDGPWQGTLTLTSGLITHDATAEVTFPAAGEAVVVEKDAGVASWPILIGAGGVVLLLAAGVGLWLRRRRLKI